MHKRKNQQWLKIKKIKIRTHIISKNNRLWNPLIKTLRVGIDYCLIWIFLENAIEEKLENA